VVSSILVVVLFLDELVSAAVLVVQCLDLFELGVMLLDEIHVGL
jgi:hypothetical protein